MDPLIKILTKSGPKAGTGLVSKTFCHQTTSCVNVHFKDRWLNPFLAAGASETCIDEFNEDNFDQGRLGFFGRDAFIPRDERPADRLQHWDAQHLFVVGASVYPFNAGHSPTGPLGALALKLGDDFVRYIKRPHLP